MSDSLDPVARRIEAAKAANERIQSARAAMMAAKQAADDANAELHVKLHARHADYPGAYNVLPDTKFNRMSGAAQMRNAGHFVIFESDPDYRAVCDADMKYRFACAEYDTAMKARLPEGWEGDMHGPDFIKLADVETWLKQRLSCLRSLRGFRPTEEAATALAGCDIRNFFRVLQHLDIWNLPERPKKPTDANQAEEALSDLLAWVCRQLPDEPYSGLTLFTGQGIATLGQLRVALLSEEQNAPPPDMFQLCSGDQRRALEAAESHKALTGDFRSLPIVQRAENICRRRYGQPLTKESLDRIRCEYHYETGNPFRVANNEQIGRVLDVVEQIPLRAYPAALAGLPDQPPAAATDQEQPATGGDEKGEGDASKKRKRHRRQRGRRRGAYDDTLHQKVYVAYVAMTPGEQSKAARTDAYDAVASRFGVTIEEARLIVKRHRAREQRKHGKQNRRRKGK